MIRKPLSLTITLIIGAFLILTLSGELILGQRLGLDQSAQWPASHSIGSVDMETLMRFHPKYPELEAAQEQLMLYEQNWLDYVHLLARQAAVDGVKSPFLEKLVGLDQLTAAQQMIEEAKRERMEYQEELARQLDEEIEGRRNDIEKAFAHEAEKLQRKAKQEILNRQVELAMLSLTQSEAEALLDEISQIQAELESKLARLEDEANRRLEAEIQRGQEAAEEKLAAYDGDLAARLEGRLGALQGEASQGDFRAAAGEDNRERNNRTGHMAAVWAEKMAGKYQLNTKGADGLEAHYLQELTRAKEEMQPLQERYDQLYGEIL
ncbi:MAG: hypothetical protein GX047_04050, partial [Firmicutes bacterium]|nr:hypothetical protein [Bacillota bacterium]